MSSVIRLTSQQGMVLMSCDKVLNHRFGQRASRACQQWTSNWARAEQPRALIRWSGTCSGMGNLTVLRTTWVFNTWFLGRPEIERRETEQEGL